MSSCALYRIPACQLSHYQITPTEAMVCDERNLPKILEHSALQQCGSVEGVGLGIGAGVSIQLPLHHTIPSRHITVTVCLLIVKVILAINPQTLTSYFPLADGQLNTVHYLSAPLMDIVVDFCI